MTYLSDREKRKKSFIRRGGLLIIVIALAVFWPHVRDTLKPATYTISSKLFWVSEFFSEGFDSFSHFFTTRSSYVSALDALEKENDELKQELALLRDSSDAMSSVSTSVKRTEVRSLFSPLSSIYDSFIISKGFDFGVPTGAVVYTGGYQAIGIVDEVHTNTSRVSLFSKNGNELEGFIENTSTMVRLVGEGGGDFIATLPKQIVVPIGSALYMKEHPQMKLGVVVASDNEPQSVSQKLYIRGAYTSTGRQRLYIDLP